MERRSHKDKINEIAASLYRDLEPTSPTDDLQEFLDQCAEHNLTVFLGSFVCHGLFGHSQPEKLTGDDIEEFIRHADPFLQTAMLQRSLLS